MIYHITSLWYSMSQPISYMDSTLFMQGGQAWISQYALVFIAHGRHLIKLCVDRLLVPQDPAQSKQ